MNRDNDLDELIGYQVQSASLRMLSGAQRVLEPHGLSVAKLTALMIIRSNPGCDQTALGRALNINRSSAMKLVNALVARHLVERRPGRDLRTNALHLVSDAEPRLAEIVAELRGSDAQMTARLTGPEQETLLRLLRKLGAAKGRRATSKAADAPPA